VVIPYVSSVINVQHYEKRICSYNKICMLEDLHTEAMTCLSQGKKQNTEENKVAPWCILHQSVVGQWRNQACSPLHCWVTRHQLVIQLNMIFSNTLAIRLNRNFFFEFHNLLEGFRVNLKTFLGLAMPNQCCQTVVKEMWGWFWGGIFRQNLDPYYTVLLSCIISCSPLLPTSIFR